MRLVFTSFSLSAVLFAWAAGIQNEIAKSCSQVCELSSEHCVEACECTVSDCYLECSKNQPDRDCSECSVKACQTQLGHLTSELK